MARSVGSDDGGSGAPARRRKPRHFGTVRRLPSGRYQASYLRDGVRHTAPTTFATKTDADLFLDDVSTDLRRGSWTDPRAAAVPLSDYANSWLAGRNDLRPTTRAKYRYLLAKHIVPQLGDRRLAQLTPSGVRAWYQALSEHAQSTADDAYRLLRAICSTAVADGHLSINPCKVKGGGAIRPSARPVASIDELRRAVEATPDRYRAALLLAAWCQLRRGELLGLCRSDVDLTRGVLRVERARVVTTYGEHLTGDPKTAAGRRNVTIPPNVLARLAHHLDSYVGEAPDSMLFVSEDGSPIEPRRLDRLWGQARKAIDRPDLHLHDLRHSGLTWFAETGATVAELMHRGGHASSSAAMRYQHATEARDRALAEALAALDDRPHST